jgi:hypothetical protein
MSCHCVRGSAPDSDRRFVAGYCDTRERRREYASVEKEGSDGGWFAKIRFGKVWEVRVPYQYPAQFAFYETDEGAYCPMTEIGRCSRGGVEYSSRVY